MRLDYRSAHARLTPERGARRSANASFAAVTFAATLIVVGEVAGSRFDSLLPPGQDSDQFTPAPMLTFLDGLVTLSLLSFPVQFVDCVFAVVSVAVSRSMREWLALATNLAVPAILIVVASR